MVDEFVSSSIDQYVVRRRSELLGEGCPNYRVTPLRSVACFAYVTSAQFRNLFPPPIQIVIDSAPMRYHIFPAPSHHSLV